MTAGSSGELAGARLAVGGAGAVGAALARALARAGAEVVVWSRDAARARAAAEGAEARAAASLEDALAGRETLVLAVADDALAAAAERVADAWRRAGAAAGTAPVALHTNGFHGTAPLAPLAGLGWGTGVLHPLVAIPRARAREVDLARGWFAVGGDARARAAARRIVAALGARELAVRDAPEAWRAYHAAASLVSGGAAALLDAALEATREALPDADEARAAYAALLASAAENLGALAPPDAVTGPAARGADATVAAQLAALAAHGEGPGSPAALYRALLARIERLRR